MCGIAGAALRGTAPGEAALRRMGAQLAHRGPENEGLYLDANVGLVHRRLSIIDLAGGRQPVLANDGELAAVVNGEIYNFVELRDELEAAGRHFATASDSETIPHAYAVHGDAFVERMHGMFAFALYDRKRHKLFLGRDRMGIKPLFYAVLPDRVIFGSELKALLPLMPGAPTINPEAFVQYLESQFNTGEQTILNEIRRVGPGELLTIDTNTLRIDRRQYWSPLQTPTRRTSVEQACEEFEPLFNQVMKEHVRSDVPYGLFLSGGSDSAIVCAALQNMHSGRIRSFSVGYCDAKTHDELPAARRIAKIFDTDHTEIRLDRDAVLGRLPHTIWAADELMRDYATLPMSLLAQEAGRTLKVVFTGEGGDEVFAGYGRYRRSKTQRVFKNLKTPGSDGFRTRPQWSPRISRRVFGAELRGAGEAFRAPYVQAWARTPAAWTYVQRAQYTDMVTSLADDNLVKTDRMLMAFSVEGRVPFVDHRIVEFGLSLPDDLKVQGRNGKLFLRRWAGAFLPADHVNGRKRGFDVPLGDWLRGEFLDRLEPRLVSNPAVRAWFDSRQIPGLFAAQRANGNAGREIWCLLQFAIWHRLFIDQPGIRPDAREDPLDWVG